MDDGKCGCKAGYYYDTSGDSPVCTTCPKDTYSDSTSLAESCSLCTTVDDHSYTNKTTGATSSAQCICHTENGFIHDPFYVHTVGLNFAPCVCKTGTYWNGLVDELGECISCPKGQYQHLPLLNTNCRDCTVPYSDSTVGNFTGIV